MFHWCYPIKEKRLVLIPETERHIAAEEFERLCDVDIPDLLSIPPVNPGSPYINQNIHIEGCSTHVFAYIEDNKWHARLYVWNVKSSKKWFCTQTITDILDFATKHLFEIDR